MTIFLTTHYLEEAEQLCGRLAIMDHGRLIALGSTAELKAQLSGGVVYEIDFAPGGERSIDLLRTLACVRELTADGCRVEVALERWECLSEVLAALNGTDVQRISLREKSLEEVFISLTGREVRE
jgi:ABC-2 type transport system ATP-binding protein